MTSGSPTTQGEGPAGEVAPDQPPPGPAERPARSRRKHALLAAGAVLVVAALVVVLLVTRGTGGGSDDGAPPAVPSDVTAPTPTTSPSATPAAPAPPSQLNPGVDVRTFGAVGDGVTDDAPALRRALAEADAVHVPAGTYLLASYATPRTTVIDADFVFSLRSGQTITADPGAVFVMADGVIPDSSAAWGGNVFLADEVNGVTIRGLTVDLNGDQNLVPAGRTITGYGLYTWQAQNITLDAVTMRDTPGQNYVVAQGGGSGFQVLDSTFSNGGTSIPGNTDQTDFSALYFTASDVVVDGVTIQHDQQPFGFSGGVELHGSRETVTRSTISDSWPAVYIGPDTNSGLPVQEDVAVTGNRFLDCGRGVVFNALGTGDIRRVDISANQFALAPAPAFDGEPVRGIDQDMPPDGNWTYHHVITGLSIRGNDFAGGGATSDGVVRLSQVHDATIDSNAVRDVAGTVFTLYSSPWDTTGVAFTGNRIAWSATAGSPAIALSFDGSSTTPEREAFTTRDVTVSGNRLDLQSRDPGSCAVHATWPDAADVTAVRVADNSTTGVAHGTCGDRAGDLAGGD